MGRGSRKELINGFLNLHKPAGMTSHDCVDHVRKILKIRRVGHGGTLDPMATGVLPIAIGSCTKLLQFIDKRKVYSGGIQFGITTDTDDKMGKVLTRRNAPFVTQDLVTAALAKMVGNNILQRPPMVSAIKVDGVRMHKRVRDGEQPTCDTVPLRRVSIQAIDLTNWDDSIRNFPVAQVLVTCSAGTYIRSIARDCGSSISSSDDNDHGVAAGANLVNLERRQSGPFLINDSVSLEQLKNTDDVLPYILKPDFPLVTLPKIFLTSVEKFQNGSFQPIDKSAVVWDDASKECEDQFVRVYHHQKKDSEDQQQPKFCGIASTAAISGNRNSLRIAPKLVFKA